MVVWLRLEIFEMGLILLPKLEQLKQRKTSLKISFDLLVNFGGKYMRMKEREKEITSNALPIPFISYFRWKKIAMTYWSLDEKEASLLVDHFLLIQCQSRFQNFPQLIHSISNEEDLKKYSFNFFQFLLFLMLHTQPCVQDIDQLYRSNFKEERQKQFLQNHIIRMLFLLTLTAEENHSGPFVINSKQFNNLELLLSGGKNLKTRTTKLSQLTPFWNQDPNELIPIEIISTWILQNFSINNFCYGISDTPPLSPIAPISSLVEEGFENLCPPIYLSQLESTTIVKTEKHFSIHSTNNVHITNCSHSYLYLLTTMRNVSISHCISCVIVLGPSSKVRLEDCENLILISACKGLNILSNQNTIFYLCCNSRPFIGNNNSNLIFAPYNTFYSLLGEHLRFLNIRTDLNSNYWSDPIPKSNSAIFKIMEPENFCQFVIPFSGLGGSTNKNPFELPCEFIKSLQQRTNQINNLRNIFSQLEESIQKQLYSSIQAHFQEWLQESGNIKQVYDLFKLKE